MDGEGSEESHKDEDEKNETRRNLQINSRFDPSGKNISKYFSRSPLPPADPSSSIYSIRLNNQMN